MQMAGILKLITMLGLMAGLSMFGDVLVFNYHRDDHDVIIEVNSTGYDQCVASPNKGAHDSGNDKKNLEDSWEQILHM
ncbi:hypothetical protein ACE6H2_007608 [Prunus campanulata]